MKRSTRPDSSYMRDTICVRCKKRRAVLWDVDHRPLCGTCHAIEGRELLAKQEAES